MPSEQPLFNHIDIARLATSRCSKTDGHSYVAGERNNAAAVHARFNTVRASSVLKGLARTHRAVSQEGSVRKNRNLGMRATRHQNAVKISIQSFTYASKEMCHRVRIRCK